MSVVLAAGATSTHEAIVFWVLAPIAVLAALGLVLVRSAVHAAVLLAVVMLSLAAFYTSQQAPFLAVVQVVEVGVALRVVARLRVGRHVVDPLVADPHLAAVVEASSPH